MVELKAGDICNATVTYKNDYGVFVDAGDFNICMAFRDNLPEGFYENARSGDPVKIEILSVDDKGRYRAAVIDVLKK